MAAADSGQSEAEVTELPRILQQGPAKVVIDQIFLDGFDVRKASLQQSRLSILTLTGHARKSISYHDSS